MVGVYSQDELIEINKLSKLHTGKSIIFSKTDFILQEFENIKQLDSEVVLITGNSDYCITDDLVKLAPQNIKVWFCQNKLTNNPKVKSIPIGIENTVECSREGQGYLWDHARLKPAALTNYTNRPPTSLIYANFNVTTNLALRSPIQTICQYTDFINWQSPNKTYSEFIDDCLNHKMIVCPEGNGPDTHRFWEVLYLNRVPIARLSKATEAFTSLPVVWVKDWAELTNKEVLLSKYEECKNNSRLLSNVSYWKDLILKHAT